VSSLVKQIQDEIVAHLSARAELAGVAIVGRRKNNIVNDVAAAIAKAGVCIYVFPALPLRFNSNNAGPYVDEFLVRVRIHEHPQLNRSLPDAYELVELVARMLDGKQYTAIAGLNPLYWSANPVTFEDDNTLVIFDLKAATSGGLVPLV